METPASGESRHREIPNVETPGNQCYQNEKEYTCD